jgi:haloacetate dehalogenase
VVATGLRGYGDSGKPPSTADHEPYSMRVIGRDQLEVMRQLGYDQFSVVGHDRGARCGYRLALDHPDAVLRLAVMDVVPVGDAYDRADKEFSLTYWQWSFLAAPEPVPEQLINAAPATLVDFMLDTWPVVKDAFPAEVRTEYIEKFRHHDTVHAICEEFRAAATLDYQQDEVDRGNRKIACPVLFLWSERGSVTKLYDDPLTIWRERADDVRGGPVPVGHFIPDVGTLDQPVTGAASSVTPTPRSRGWRTGTAGWTRPRPRCPTPGTGASWPSWSADDPWVVGADADGLPAGAVRLLTKRRWRTGGDGFGSNPASGSTN